MTTFKDIVQIDLVTCGFTLFDHDTKDEALLSLATEIGIIQPDDNENLIQYLKPKSKGQGIRGSFSYNLGLNEFPYHTDTAFWEKPAQLLLMASEKSSSCYTILIDTKELFDSLTESQRTTFLNSVFRLKTIEGIKFVSIVSHKEENLLFRYDPNIMTPFNSSARKAFEIITNFIFDTKSFEVKWTGNNVLILDNWRFLHKRSECKFESERLLKRIYINK